jgi:hypothetical protein
MDDELQHGQAPVEKVILVLLVSIRLL